jgi:hypothetical protein
MTVCRKDCHDVSPCATQILLKTILVIGRGGDNIDHLPMSRTQHTISEPTFSSASSH